MNMLAKIKRFFIRRLMHKLAKKHQPQPMPAQVKSIALWQFGGVGDMLLATPVIQALQRQYPQADIHIWCSFPPFSTFLLRFPQVKSVQAFAVYDFDVRSMCKAETRQRLQDCVKSMAQQQPDIVVNLHHPKLLDWWMVEWQVIDRLEPTMALGFSPDTLDGSLLDTWLPASITTSQHYTKSYQQLLGKMGVDCGLATQFPLLPSEKEKARVLLQSSQHQSWVCLHMGGRRLAMEQKMWSAHRFIALAEQLHELGVALVLIGVESERDMGKELCLAIPSALNCIGKTTMGEMAAVIAQAQVFIGHDSGPFHIAVAMDTPALAICGRPDAEPEYLAYDKPHVQVVTGRHPDDITVNQVFQAAIGLLP